MTDDGTGRTSVTPDEQASETTHAPMRRHLHVVPAYRPSTDGVMHLAHLGPYDTELGGHLPNVTLAYRTWGTLNEARDNAVIILHALTGDSLAAGDGGWWEPVIGTGGPIDTDTHFVLCANILGGCQGSTGPASRDPEGRFWGTRFPHITIGDIVATQRMLAEKIGITKLVAFGGSIGGFQALEWATRHPDMVKGAAAIAASGALNALGIAVHGEVGRRAIIADPEWRGGNYLEEGTFPEQGLAIARMAAMTTYHSRHSLGSRFGRNPAVRPPLYEPFGTTFDVEGYLHYHGRALVQRFDANSYLYLTRAMDMYDIGRDGGDTHWFDRISAPLLLTGISSDWLFPPDDVELLAERIRDRGKQVTYALIDSPNGHDAFLKDWNDLNPIVGRFMRSLEAAGEVAVAGGAST
jgi:homoserine O-acetyltransferase/O-succinyltransferase